MASNPGPGGGLSVGSGPGWYVIEYPLPRTGVVQVDYTNAPNEQTAAQFNPGTIVLGGPYKTQAAAESAFNGSPTGKAYNANPHSPRSSGVNGPASTTNQQPVNPLGGLAAIGDFFGRLAEANTWLRVGEVVIGVILIAVGVARLTKAVPVATQVAKTVGAAAI